MQKASGQFLSLSLFVLLLAFFVFLQSLSSFEDERVDAVTRSLETTFSAAPLGPDVGLTTRARPDAPLGRGDVAQPLGALDALFNAHIAGLATQRNDAGTQMRLTTTADAFERALAAEATGGESPFRAMLVTLLQSDENQGHAWRLEIVMGAGGAPSAVANADPKAARAAVVRVANMAERLEVLGLPERLVTAGLGPGATGRLDLYIRPWAPLDVGGARAVEEGAP